MAADVAAERKSIGKNTVACIIMHDNGGFLTVQIHSSC